MVWPLYDRAFDPWSKLNLPPVLPSGGAMANRGQERQPLAKDQGLCVWFCARTLKTGHEDLHTLT